MRRPPRVLIYTLFLLSGCTGLIYEVVWTRELIFLLGGTTYAITTVLVAFMSGLALGSYFAGRISDRLQQPGRAYGFLEIVVGLYVLIVPVLLGIAHPLYRVLYPYVADMPWVLTGLRFLVGSLVLLLPTTCMGATLPILVGYVTQAGHAFGRSVGHLYGINTFGAVLGTVLAGFWLIPNFGLTRTTWVAATANLIIGLIAVFLLRSGKKAPLKGPAKALTKKTGKAESPLVVSRALCRVVLIAFAISGFAAMVYQIAWTRALIMSIGSSTYAFTCILAAFIFGLALGSLMVARWVDRWKQPILLFGILEFGIALSAVLIVPIHGRVPLIVQRIIESHHLNYSAMLWLEFMLVIAVTIVPTLLMGAIFPLVTRIVAVRQGESGAAVGRAYAVNTVGTIVGSFLAGFFMIRSNVLGIQNSIIAAAILNALVGLWLVYKSKPVGDTIDRRGVPAGIAVLLIFLIAVMAGRWNRELFLSAPYMYEGATAEKEVLYYGEGVDTTVAVTRDKGYQDRLVLSVNGKPDASTMLDLATQMLLGHLPSLLSPPDTKSACIIGFGSGITLSAVARYPFYERIDSIEISDEVMKASTYFASYNYDILNTDRRVNTIRADGRNHLLLTDHVYDVIVSEPSNPWITGVSNLFTREFFTLCRNRLSENGILCAWVQGYSISLLDFKLIVGTLSDVFGHISVWTSGADDYILLAGRNPSAVPFELMQERLSIKSVGEDLYRIGIKDVFHVVEKYRTSGRSLRDWIADAPVNTDDNALLEFSAPQSLYLNHTQRILRGLIDCHQSPFDEVILFPKDAKVRESASIRMANAIKAQEYRYEAGTLWVKESYAKALELLVEGYKLTPDDIMLYRAVRKYMKPFLKVPESRRSPSLNASISQMDSRREPVMVLKTDDIFKNSFDILKARAEIAGHKQQWPLAIEYAKEALQLNSEDGDLLSFRAYALLEQGQTAEAIELLDDFIEQHPHDGPANNVRGYIAALQNDLETAMVTIDKALKSGCTSPEALFDEIKQSNVYKHPRFQAMLNKYKQP
ncbi:MAG: fused MFS/spermidine synthase [Planctomycetota bacterium]|jgi:spermidine synthase